MTKLNAWKKVSAVLVLCAATVIAAQAQVFATLASFDANHGSSPEGPLVQGTDGNLYGTTINGLTYDTGTVFKIAPDGTLTTLYNFCPAQSNCTHGSQPSGGLILATDGKLYGTTRFGGTCDGGTVFRITPTGVLTTLYNFCSQLDGADPYAGLIQVADGNFYGTTIGSGVNGYGTVFKITPAGELATLHSFDWTDGANPFAGVVQGTDGNLYGTTSQGGAGSGCCGTVYKITPEGSFTMLYSFQPGGGDGPRGTMVQGVDGSFYGTTYGGGYIGEGTAFKITPAGTLTYLWTFENTYDGVHPTGLTQATDGNFYGTTNAGAEYGVGTIFNLSSAGSLTTLHNFEQTDGNYPVGPPVQATNGTLYGTTSSGGNNNDCGTSGCGTVYSLSMGFGPFVAFVQDLGKVGETGGILGQGFTGTTSVSINGIQAQFKVVSDTFIRATVPPGATTGFVTVVTPSGTLTSNVPFRVLP